MTTFQAILFAAAVTIWGNFINSPQMILWLGVFPLTGGLISGLILGDPLTGLIAGGFIQITYFGWVTVGGTLPSNQFLAGYFGTALVIMSGASPETAPALAIPIGLLGALLHQTQMTVNSLFVHRGDKYAETGNFKGIVFMQAIAPVLLNILLYGVPAFLLIKFGSGIIETSFQNIPEWLVNGLTYVGAIMPALGIGMLLYNMGKTHIIPFFFIGFLLTKSLGLSTNVIAALGILVALIYYFSRMRSEGVTQNE
jgi:mannose/fructose/N-acetylgalactosamine-specific phosphotransferase system component IIC